MVSGTLSSRKPWPRLIRIRSIPPTRAAQCHKTLLRLNIPQYLHLVLPDLFSGLLLFWAHKIPVLLYPLQDGLGSHGAQGYAGPIGYFLEQIPCPSIHVDKNRLDLSDAFAVFRYVAAWYVIGGCMYVIGLCWYVAHQNTPFLPSGRGKAEKIPPETASTIPRGKKGYFSALRTVNSSFSRSPFFSSSG